jgi:hypothetical protein
MPKNGSAAQRMLADDEHAINEETIERLQQDARAYTTRGQVLFGIAIAAGLATMAVSYHLTTVDVDALNHADNGGQMLVLLLVRGTLFGSLAVGFLFGLFSVANAYIDQATRFRKRLYSAHMLNYAFRTFSEDIKRDGEVSLADLVNLFSAWNENVDSAFSRVKFQKQTKDLHLGGKNGASMTEPNGRKQA